MLHAKEVVFARHAGGVQCVYDIGANLGNHSVYFATHSKASVFSFEPVSANFKLLEKNIAQNGLTHRTKLFAFALGEADGSAKMRYAIADNMGSAAISDEGSVEVCLKRLDDLGLPPPDFVKIDVEGYELHVLRGMERTLRESAPILWVEIQPDQANNSETYQFLTSLGYFPTDRVGINYRFEKITGAEQCFLQMLSMCQQNNVEAKQELDRLKSSFSWKITAPLRRIRRIFG